ncbi:MAG: DUF4118 domain-containing protein [Lachnospiraceae bacterium]
MKKNLTRQHLHDLLLTIGLILVTTVLSFILFFYVSDNPANITLFYILGVITIARLTNGYFYGILTSVFGVIFINCFFTYPYFQLNFILPDYPFTFFCMLFITLITSTTTTHLKQQAEILALHEKSLAEADKEKMRANLLRAVSHDLRTPLTSIIGTVSSLLENDKDYTATERKELTQTICDDASWLLNMVENLLSVTKIHTADSKLNTSPEIVEEVVAEAISRLKKRLPQTEVEVTIPSEILMIPMDAMLIEQVLMNLIENSVVHAQSKKPIQLLVKNEPDVVSFHVIDFGSGIQVHLLETIFDGISSSSSSDVRKGMGIGLSICKTIINAHNGTITALNHEQGAEFLFTLPKEEPHAKV